jgi:hypothetical protein
MMKQTDAEKTKQTRSHADREETTATNPLAQENTQAADDATSRGWTLNRVLLALSAAGPVLFLAVSTVLGVLDPDFDVMTEPVSALAWGRLDGCRPPTSTPWARRPSPSRSGCIAASKGAGG